VAWRTHCVGQPHENLTPSSFGQTTWMDSRVIGKVKIDRISSPATFRVPRSRQILSCLSIAPAFAVLKLPMTELGLVPAQFERHMRGPCQSCWQQLSGPRYFASSFRLLFAATPHASSRPGTRFPKAASDDQDSRESKRNAVRQWRYEPTLPET
jgi:hypothetical protein